MIVYKFRDYYNKPVSLDEINLLFENNDVENKYAKEQAELIKNLDLDFEFIKDNIPVEPFYLFSEALANNLKMSDMNNDKDSIVYITLCALAIIFEEEKERYKKMFEELRLRGIYGVLKPIVNAMNSLKGLFEELASKSGKEVKDFKEAFNYTELFSPFMMAVSKVVSDNKIAPDDLEVTDSFTNEIIKSMKEMTLSGKFKETVDKIDIEVKDTGDDIKKFAQFKDEVEMIQDDKEH